MLWIIDFGYALSYFSYQEPDWMPIRNMERDIDSGLEPDFGVRPAASPCMTSKV